MIGAAALSGVSLISGFALVLLPICYRFSGPDRFHRAARSRRWGRVRGPFTPAGLLPPGLHPATIQELEERFGQHTPRRAQLFTQLGELLVLVRSFQLFTTLFVDGSFVTDKADPGDIDAVLVLPRGDLGRLLQHPRRAEVADSARIKQTFEVDLFIQPAPRGMVDFFQTLRPDEAIRRGVPPAVRRGILEVAL